MEVSQGKSRPPKRGMAITCTNTLRNNIWRSEPKSMGTQCGMLPKMSTENAELLQFFETVEKLFEIYEVPDDIMAKLLIPLLTAQAKSLARLSRKWAISPS